VKRLSRALDLEVFSLHDEVQKSGQPRSGPAYGESWLIHGINIERDNARRLLDEATHIIWLNAPFLAAAGRLSRLFMTELIRSPGKICAFSPTGVLAAGWREYRYQRDLIEAVYQADDRQDRWHQFSGWKGRIELRRWLKHFDSQTQDERYDVQTSPPFYDVSDDGEYYYPYGLVIFF